MSRIFGGNADFNFDSQAIEDELSSVTMTFDVATGDVTAFDDAYQNVVAGKKSTRVDIVGAFDATDDQADDVIFSAFDSTVKTLYFIPGGGSASANNPKYNTTASGLTGALVSRHSLNLPVGDKASFTTSFQLSGSTTRETS